MDGTVARIWPRGEDFGAEKFLVFDVKERLKNLRVEPL